MLDIFDNLKFFTLLMRNNFPSAVLNSYICTHLQKEGTSLLLADIFSNCYSKEPIKEIRDVPYIGGARIGKDFRKQI